MGHASTIGKNLLNSNISFTCTHNMTNFGPLTAEIGLPVYCSNVAHRRPTKLCTMFGCFLGWYAIYTLSGAFAPWRNFARCKIHFASKSCVLLYWQRYCTAVQQRTSAKLCGVVQGMELRKFGRGRHLYSAGRPSRWASAHILVLFIFCKCFLIMA